MSSTAKPTHFVYNSGMANMKLSEVEKLARLSKLTVTEKELHSLSSQLSESLEYVQNLEDIDTTQVPDSYFTTDAKNVMDDDVVDEGIMLTQQEALKNAAATKDGYFVIKRIL